MHVGHVPPCQQGRRCVGRACELASPKPPTSTRPHLVRVAGHGMEGAILQDHVPGVGADLRQWRQWRRAGGAGGAPGEGLPGMAQPAARPPVAASAAMLPPQPAAAPQAPPSRLLGQPHGRVAREAKPVLQHLPLWRRRGRRGGRRGCGCGTAALRQVCAWRPCARHRHSTRAQVPRSPWLPAKRATTAELGAERVPPTWMKGDISASSLPTASPAAASLPPAAAACCARCSASRVASSSWSAPAAASPAAQGPPWAAAAPSAAASPAGGWSAGPSSSGAPAACPSCGAAGASAAEASCTRMVVTSSAARWFCSRSRCSCAFICVSRPVACRRAGQGRAGRSGERRQLRWWH